VTATVGFAKRKEKPMIRTFESGATRDTEEGKLDYEGFLSPLVLERYAQFMHLNRTQKDGAVRASDNWQLGITNEAYMKSMWRHFMAVWKHHRKIGDAEDLETALCAMLFNVSGMLHEVLEGKRRPEPYLPPHEKEIEKLKKMQEGVMERVRQDAMDSTTRCPLCFERSGFHTNFCPTNKNPEK
jgi:hypothetical protein